MSDERSGGSRTAIDLPEKTRAVSAMGQQHPRVEHEIPKFWMIVRPSAGIRLGPKGCLMRINHADTNVRRRLRAASIAIPGNGTAQNIADLDRAVTARTKKIERRDTREGADFMLRRSTAERKELLDGFEMRGSRCLEYAESERLREGRRRPIKDHIRAPDANGLRRACWTQAPAGQGKFAARVTFSGFQATGQKQVGEEHWIPCKPQSESRVIAVYGKKLF